MTFIEIRNNKSIGVVSLYKDDSEIAEHLRKLGLGKNAAVVLVSLWSRKRTQFDLMQIFDWEKSKNKKKSENKIQKQKSQFKVAQGLSELREIHLFEWDNDKELIDFLSHYGIDWVKDGIIERIDNGKTIMVSNGRNHATLSLNNDFSFSHPILNSWKWKPQEYVTKVLLIIDDGRTDEFDAKMIGILPTKLNIFKNRGWLNEQEIGQFPDDAKYKEYSLKVPFENIIAELEKEHREFYDDLQKKIDKLKKSL